MSDLTTIPQSAGSRVNNNGPESRGIPLGSPKHNLFPLAKFPEPILRVQWGRNRFFGQLQTIRLNPNLNRFRNENHRETRSRKSVQYSPYIIIIEKNNNKKDQM